MHEWQVVITVRAINANVYVYANDLPAVGADRPLFERNWTNGSFDEPLERGQARNEVCEQHCFHLHLLPPARHPADEGCELREGEGCGAAGTASRVACVEKLRAVGAASAAAVGY